jgi:hypothetical protein
MNHQQIAKVIYVYNTAVIIFVVCVIGFKLYTKDQSSLTPQISALLVSGGILYFVYKCEQHLKITNSIRELIREKQP